MPKVDGRQDTNAYTSDTNKNLNTYRASGMKEFGDNKNTLAITSTNIEVFSNGMRVGLIQSLTPSESRTIVKLQELGTEGVVQSVPSNTNGGQLAITRFAIYNNNLFNSLGLTRDGKFTTDNLGSTSKDNKYKTFANPFKTLKDQRVPLEIQVKTKMPSDSDETSYLIETYVDCWLSTYSKSIAANTITISEQATIQYSDVISKYS